MVNEEKIYVDYNKQCHLKWEEIVSDIFEKVDNLYH